MIVSVRDRRAGAQLNLVLVGAVALALAAILLAVAYNATRKLPFVPVYELSVDVPAATGLGAASEVRIGGARIGQVQDVKAVVGRDGRPHARLRLTIDDERRPLPVDSRAEVRTKSLLGAKYLALVPGRAEQGIPRGGVLPLGQAEAGFDLDTAFRIFDADTRRGIRGTVGGLGGALAGRGTALNAAIGSFAALAPPLTRTTDALAAPRTRLAGLVRGWAAVARALAPVSPQLARLVDDGATTFAALGREGDALEASVRGLPGAELAATAALHRADDVLDDVEVLLDDLRPGTRGLARTSARLGRAVRAATPALDRTNGAPRVVELLASSLARVARRAAPLTTALHRGREAVGALDPMLKTFTEAQVVCNVAGLWTRNLSSAISDGNGAGNWFRAQVQQNYSELTQNPIPQSTLNANPSPVHDASECEVGTEPYRLGIHIGSPLGRQTIDVEKTTADPDVVAEARQAGLLEREEVPAR